MNPTEILFIINDMLEVHKDFLKALNCIVEDIHKIRQILEKRDAKEEKERAEEEKGRVYFQPINAKHVFLEKQEDKSYEQE